MTRTNTTRSQPTRLRLVTKRVEAGRRKVLYLDMDNVLVDFMSGVNACDARVRAKYAGRYDEIPGVFAQMQPLEGALDAYRRLRTRFDTYIASTAPWENSSAWSDKREWVERHLGRPARKRLILTHHKNLLRGDFIVDDRTKRGVDRFEGEHVHFGSRAFPDWKSVVEYLLARA